MITRNQERRFRIDIAIRDVMTKTFQHFLAKHILPADLINEIERRRHKHLSEEDKKTIQSGNFDKFDVTLLNKLFVNYGDIIFENGLRIVCSKEMPYPNHVTVSDDFNRLRIYRNKYVHQIHTENEDIAIEAMEGIKQDFIDICLRMKERNLPEYKKVEYVAQLQVIFNSDLDRIEELHKRVTNLERARKRLVEEDIQFNGNSKRRKKRILTSINNLTENTKQMRKSKALLIVGEYGVGKSSFVNTVLTAITGIYHEHCQVAQASSSKTNYLDVKCPAEYLKITTDEDEKLWYPTFVDMVGMDKANFAPFDIILEYILDGKLKPFTDLTDFCNNIKKGRKMVQMEKREGPIVDAIVFLLAPKSEQNPTVLMENINIVLKRSAKEIPIFVVMTKMDECDLAEEAIRDLKRKICSSFVINMDRILECVNYKRSDSQSGWWDNDAVEKVLNFLTSICDPHLQRRDLIRMEFEKETSFIHVDGEKVLNIFAIAVLVLILSILGYLLLNTIGKVFITRAGNMRF
eukprot:XP_011437049.1 PREDICTED: uncharacterized protein LOC105335071 [Crassostrea gigas]